MNLTRLITGVLIVIFIFQSCALKKDKPAFTDENIYLDYVISATEEDSVLTILLQFKDQMTGDALLIPPPGKVSLDGVEIPADSSKIGGVYYEINRRPGDFPGDHEILYTDQENNHYMEKIKFEPLKLLSSIPDTLDGSGFDLSFSGIGNRDQLIIIYRDTANFHDDQRKAGEPGENRINLSAQDLETLSEGPIQLELLRESKYNMQQTPPAGGQLKSTYTIKKELFLRRSK